MDWLTQHSAMIDCAKKRVQLEYPGQVFYFVQGVRPGELKQVISAIKAYRSLSKGCVGYLASIVVSSSPIVEVQDISVVCEYLVFFWRSYLEYRHIGRWNS